MACECSSSTPYAFQRRSVSVSSAPPNTHRKRNPHSFERLIADQKNLKRQLLDTARENELCYEIIQKLTKDLERWKIKYDFRTDQNRKLEKRMRRLSNDLAHSKNPSELDDLKHQIGYWQRQVKQSSNSWENEVKKLQGRIHELENDILKKIDALLVVNEKGIKEMDQQMSVLTDVQDQ